MKRIHLSLVLALGLLVFIIPPVLAYAPMVDDDNPDPDPLDLGIVRFIKVEHPNLAGSEPHPTPPFTIETHKNPISHGVSSKPGGGSFPGAILGAGNTRAGLSNGSFLSAAGSSTLDNPAAQLDAAVRDARRQLDRTE